MKYLMARVQKQLLLAGIFMLLSAPFSSVFAQGDVGNDPDIPNIPIDGGLSLLLVAGAAYGGKKVHEYRNRKSKKLSEQEES
jgi:hypothetical protein